MSSMSGVLKNAPSCFIIFYRDCMKPISCQKSVGQFAALKYGFSPRTKYECLLMKDETGWEENPQQLLY